MDAIKQCNSFKKDKPSPWPTIKDPTGWTNETFYNMTGTNLQCVVNATMAEAKKRNAALMALNVVLYYLLSLLISFSITFLISAVAKIEWVHVVKIFWAVILIVIIKFINKYLQIDL